MEKWSLDTFNGTRLTLASTIISGFNSDFSTSYPVSTMIDVDFQINKLNGSYLSPIAEFLINDLQQNVTQFQTAIIDLFKTKFYEKYSKLFKIFKADYNPIENYNMTETEDSTTTTGSMYSNALGSDSGIYAYNSTAVSDTDKSSNSGSGRTDGGEILDKTLTRTGNIGVQTTQEMVGKTLDLYDKYNIVDKIYSDLLSILSMNCY